MTSPETSYTKNVVNELKLLLVTHTICFNIWFGRYGILKSRFSSGHIELQVLGQVFGQQNR
jgi:hypothetical protein